MASLVCLELYKIFSIQGPPAILQSDNGTEFKNEIVRVMCASYGIKMVHGRPRHPQSQGSVERSNDCVGKMLMSWMLEHKSKHWSVGLPEVQFRKNLRYHSGHKNSPYELLYCQPPNEGVKSLVLDKQLIKRLQNVSDLAMACVVVNDDDLFPAPNADDAPLTAADIGIDLEQFNAIDLMVIIIITII